MQQSIIRPRIRAANTEQLVRLPPNPRRVFLRSRTQVPITFSFNSGDIAAGQGSPLGDQGYDTGYLTTDFLNLYVSSPLPGVELDVYCKYVVASEAPNGAEGSETRYSYSITGQAANVTTANDATVGTIDWTNPSEAEFPTEDLRYTYAELDNAEVSKYLLVTNWEFAIPTGKTISGVSLLVRKADVDEDTLVHDNSIRLVKAGSVTGDDKANLSYWSSPESGGSFPSSEYGGSDDLWGATLSPADVNASNFGIAISAAHVNTGTIRAGIQNLALTVYWGS